MQEPDIKKAKTYREYVAKRDAWTAARIEESLGVGDKRKVTAHDMVKAAIGPRRSLNVEDRRSHKEKGKLYRLDVKTGEELPEIEYDFKPINPPKPGGGVSAEEFEKMKAELSEYYQEAARPQKSKDWERFKHMGKRTLWNMADKLEKAGW